MRSPKRNLWIPLICLFFFACGGPSVCECDREAGREEPDDALLEECREILGAMEMEEVLEALQDCEGE